MTKIFIDGKAGTTGLKIRERFSNRSDIELLEIPESDRKNDDVKSSFINKSDFVFLCLPDDAARASVALCKNPATRIIDCSTAHRVNPSWAYGFPELSEDYRAAIKNGSRVATPGCYASGAISILYPLVKCNLLPRDYPVVINAISGYSGGGKKAITQYESPYDKNSPLATPRLYALSEHHKHLPEITKVSGLAFDPVFSPAICNYYEGMCVTIAFHTRLLTKKVTPADIEQIFSNHYKDSYFVRVKPLMDSETLSSTFLCANNLNGTNFLDLTIYGNEERVLVTATLDNLGKGASGAAVQCLNIMMGLDEKTGLNQQ